MATIGELIIKLKASTASFVQDLDRVKNLSFSTAQQCGRSFQIIGAAAVGVIGTLAALTARSLETSVKMAADMEHTAEKVGMTVEAFSGLSFAAKNVNIDQEQLSLGLARLAKNAMMASEGSKMQATAFKAIHVSVTDAHHALLPMMDLILSVADRFAKADNTTTKTAIAMTAFGKAGFQMIPFLNLGREGIQAFIKQAEDLGIIIDTKTAKGAVELEQKMRLLEGRFQAIKLEILRQTMPTLLSFADMMIDSGKKIEGAAPEVGFWTEALQGTILFLDDLGFAVASLWERIKQVGLEAKAFVTGFIAGDLTEFYSIGPETDAKINKMGESVKALANQYERMNKPAVGNLFSLRPGLDPKVAEYMKGLSEADFDKLRRDAEAAHITVSKLAAQLANAKEKGVLDSGDDKAAKAKDELADHIKHVVEELQIQIHTMGFGADAAERYRLKIEGAAKADLLHIRALQEKKNQPAIAAELRKEADYVAAEKNAAALDAALEKMRADLEGIVGSATRFANIPLPAWLKMPTLSTDIAAQTSALIKAKQDALAVFGKTPLQGEIESLGPGATADSIARIRALDQQLKILQAGGYLQWVAQVAQENMRNVHGWDEAAIAVGGFHQKARAALNELIIQTESFGSKITHTISQAMDRVTSEFAKMVVTGKHNFRELIQGIEEELVKAGLQFAISGLAQKILGPPRIPGQGPGQQGPGQQGHGGITGTIAGAAGGILGKVFGLHGSKPDGSSGNPFYVIQKSGVGGGASGTAGPGGNILAGGGISGAMQSVMAKMKDTLTKIFTKIAHVIAGLFGGHFAGGGRPPMGEISIVGETGPEAFVPDSPGRIIPQSAFAAMAAGHSAGGSKVINLGGFHNHGVRDMDSFKHSRSQIFTQMHTQMAHAAARLG
jgi:hypothetical protein